MAKKLLLDDHVSTISGIGPKKSATLCQAGYSSVFDLLRIYPSKYQDRRTAIPLSLLKPEMQCLLRARLVSIKSYHARRGLTVISAEFSDSTGRLAARWFNRVYLTRQLKPGKEYWLFGTAAATKGMMTISNPEIEPIDEEIAPTANKIQLTPVYPSSSKLSEAKISPLSLRKIIDSVLNLVDWQASLPAALKNSSFNVIADALEQIHRPESDETLKKARHTMAFFDQVLFQIGVLKRRESLTGFLTLPDATKPPPFESPWPLPFKLTKAQEQTLGEIIADLRTESDRPPMNRLLQGDVGSGKTLVAFLSMIHFAMKLSPSSQCAFMAPTEILVRQHLHNFKKFFPQFAHLAVIITGSQKSTERRPASEAAASGSARFIFGTHALFQEKLQFDNLDLCIIDEQQRFGVNHRRLLFRKGRNPHQLLLSATPIPRTLSLTIFGDMDTSVINEMPPGRKPVKTKIVKNFTDTLPLLRETLGRKQQVYIVCPLIELSDVKEWTSVEEAAEKVAEHLPDASYACLTGQQTWEEKEQTMQAFKAGEIDLVIATTVIEVGVDNPQATLMIIENADCFGLSQLHQLRGRVGRGADESACILVSHLGGNSERLDILASTNDGFELSLEDLKLRGPGDLVGTRQSGLSHPCFSHRIPQKLVENARIRAYEILTIEQDEVREWFSGQMIKSFGDSYRTFMEGG
ncbi:MAG: ATP-dependent DNA helicase RecG [Erysipelotrichia bacterium]|nr:ATP-dependent DNA helicase RecG [Erysipelotrichia bacterium]